MTKANELMFTYQYTRKPNGRHCVRTLGAVPFAVDFEARKHAALYLRIGDVMVKRFSFTGNKDAKIDFAIELLKKLTFDASYLREVVDRGIAQAAGKERELRTQARKYESDAQFLRDLEL